MKKFLLVVFLVILSANFASADHYETVHRPGLGETLGTATANVVMLPFAVVGGFAGGLVKGFAGGDERVLVRDQPEYTTTTYTIPPTYPMYAPTVYAPPIYAPPMYVSPIYNRPPPLIQIRFGGGGGHRGDYRQR
jgi:hypothetical protein